jgi:lipoprotein-anchoring transpeptidase ErfK/SrfK
LIGKTGSHGCFRLANWDALRLAKLVKVGTPVKFVSQPSQVLAQR